MPWKNSDARKFTKKARSKTAKKQWRAVANSALARGLSDASAVRMANSVVKRRKIKKK